ncbi:integral membrane protein [Rhypophila decipiens]|uniref:Integral membrane protein n=1 Tax=Rhypophila decipiens TaxID=261697 RepID=A0AAN6YDG0_9PEZI|nr:integral membrane protein [Rhypophila decipiens]
MANLGRYACVAIPFLLTLASLISLLIAGLAGVADKSLYMFQVNTTDLSISPVNIENVLDKITSRAAFAQDLHNAEGILDDVKDAVGDKAGDVIDDVKDAVANNPDGGNLTAADLGLFDLYDIGLWGYCYTPKNGSRACTKSQFNWAEKELNTTTTQLNDLIQLANSAGGQNITLPKEISEAVKTFGTVTRWTEIVFIIAYIALGVELFFGIFANCTRVFSCITALIAVVATVAVCSAAALATATSAIVVGAVETTAKFYGVQASINTKFLAAVWIAAAFAIAAGLFWMFTCCCCAPDHSSRKSRSSYRDSTHEKLIPGGASGPYQPVPGGNTGYSAQYPAAAPQSYGYAAPAHDARYEPYAHGRV